MSGAKVRKGDKVEVIAGKEKGKQGKVIRTVPEKSQVVIEGINMIKRHTRPSRTNVQGGIQTKEGPIHISNVEVICSACGVVTRIGYRFNADGTKIRICRKCSMDLDKS